MSRNRRKSKTPLPKSDAVCGACGEQGTLSRRDAAMGYKVPTGWKFTIRFSPAKSSWTCNDCLEKLDAIGRTMARGLIDEAEAQRQIAALLKA